MCIPRGTSRHISCNYFQNEILFSWFDWRKHPLGDVAKNSNCVHKREAKKETRVASNFSHHAEYTNWIPKWFNHIIDMFCHAAYDSDSAYMGTHLSTV